MKVEQKQKNDVGVFYIKGEINIDTVSRLKVSLRAAGTGMFRKVLLNLKDVEYVDSVGMAFLIELLKMAHKNEVVILLSNLSPKLRSIFGVTHLEKIFTICDTEDEALRKFDEL